MMYFKNSLTYIFFFCLGALLPLYATPDLTVVGFIKAEDGLGKVPITILETLGDAISANVICHNPPDLRHAVPRHTFAALHNSDTVPGKVALLTDCIWHLGGKPTSLIPNESIVKIAYSMHESTQLPKMWVEILNEELDAVVVPDPFLVKVYKNSGVNIPIFVLPIPMMLEPYFAHPIHSKSPSIPFVFGDASANKNPAVLLRAFAKAFGKNPHVHLVMRAGFISQETREIIHRLINKYKLKNVTLEEGHLFLEDYITRLSSFDCYVNLSKGEGFSFIPREALALGIPVIITNNTASKTICNSGFVRAVPSKQRVPSPNLYRILFNDSCGDQFGCKVDDVFNALVDVYKHYKKYAKKAHKGRAWVSQYDCKNVELQQSYLTLIKPKQVLLGEKNAIENETIVTNSPELYQKYMRLIESNIGGL